MNQFDTGIGAQSIATAITVQLLGTVKDFGAWPRSVKRAQIAQQALVEFVKAAAVATPLGALAVTVALSAIK